MRLNNFKGLKEGRILDELCNRGAMYSHFRLIPDRTFRRTSFFKYEEWADWEDNIAELGLTFPCLTVFNSTNLYDTAMKFLDLPWDFSEFCAAFRIHGKIIGSREFGLFFNILDFEEFNCTIFLEMNKTSFIRDIHLWNRQIIERFLLYQAIWLQPYEEMPLKSSDMFEIPCSNTNCWIAHNVARIHVLLPYWACRRKEHSWFFHRVSDRRP